MSRPRALDLFCGEGGVSMGWHQAGFDVVGVDTDPARLARYPFESHCGDALEFVAAHGHEFDVLLASPPCTGYSRGTAALPDRLERYDRLIPATRDLLVASGLPYVIENVADAAPELESPMTLCGSMFGLTALDVDGTVLHLRRHRLFESNVFLTPPATCHHPKGVQWAGAYGGARRDKTEAREVRRGGYVPSVEVLRELLGTPWMSEKGCFLSIPPVYARHIAEQVLDVLPAAVTAGSGVPA